MMESDDLPGCTDAQADLHQCWFQAANSFSYLDWKPVLGIYVNSADPVQGLQPLLTENLYVKYIKMETFTRNPLN